MGLHIPMGEKVRNSYIKLKSTDKNGPCGHACIQPKSMKHEKNVK
jgi:hypothetical protein